MRDTKQWAAKYIELHGFESLLQHLIGNVSFEEAAMSVMEGFAERANKNVEDLKDKLQESVDENFLLREQLKIKNSTISDLKTKADGFRKTLEEFLSTI